MQAHPPNNDARFNISDWRHSTRRASEILFMGHVKQGGLAMPDYMTRAGSILAGEEETPAKKAATYAEEGLRLLLPWAINDNSSVGFTDQSQYKYRDKLPLSHFLYTSDTGANMAVATPMHRLMKAYGMQVDQNYGSRRVRTKAEVDRVLINGGKADGVVLTTGESIYARKHVFLCAGAFSSPMILARSGIAPGTWQNSSKPPAVQHLLRFDSIGTLWETPGIGLELSVPLKRPKGETMPLAVFYAHESKDLNVVSLVCGGKVYGGSMTESASINANMVSIGQTGTLDQIAVFAQSDRQRQVEFQERYNFSIPGGMDGYDPAQFGPVKGVFGFTQPRPDVTEYQAGRMAPRRHGVFDVNDLDVNFNWQSVDIIKTAHALADYMMKTLLPAVAKANLTFSSVKEIVEYGVEHNDTDYLYYTIEQRGGKATVRLADGTHVVVGADYSSPKEYLKEVRHTSGWHYVGSTASAHDPETMEIVPRLTVADASSYTAPTHSNSMASTVAIGHYAASRIVSSKSKLN